jgi:maleylacetate reductase
MKDFRFSALPWNVMFGPGTFAHVPDILEKMSLDRPLLITTPGRAGMIETLRARPGMPPFAVFSGATAHVPFAVLEEARRAAREFHADCTISIGGGSATGLGKALRLHDGLPQVAVPTTFAGSEMTDIWGITGPDGKLTGREARVLPSMVVYDPDLLASLPLSVAGPSTLNAMAQAVAHLCGEQSTPIGCLVAREAISILHSGLRRLIDDAGDRNVLARLLYGSCLAGMALATARTGLHHRICHVLGGMYNLPHAETHAVVLPYSMALQTGIDPIGSAAVALALGVENAAQAFYELLQVAGGRRSLRELGLSADDIDAAAAAVAGTPIAGAARSEQEIWQVLDAALAGRPPTAA